MQGQGNNVSVNVLLVGAADSCLVATSIRLDWALSAWRKADPEGFARPIAVCPRGGFRHSAPCGRDRVQVPRSPSLVPFMPASQGAGPFPFSAAPRAGEGVSDRNSWARPHVPGEMPQSRGRPGPKPILPLKVLVELHRSPSWPTELARCILASASRRPPEAVAADSLLASRIRGLTFAVRAILRRLEAYGLLASWFQAHTDGGGRVVRVRAWRLTAAAERLSGRPDANATSQASRAVARVLEERLAYVRRLNRLAGDDFRRAQVHGIPEGRG